VIALVVRSPIPSSVGYCVADVGYEAYKLHNRGYVSEKGHPTTMTQLVVERSVFQAIASIAVPFLVQGFSTQVGVLHRTLTSVDTFTGDTHDGGHWQARREKVQRPGVHEEVGPQHSGAHDGTC
jgi:hypothetical protein